MKSNRCLIALALVCAASPCPARDGAPEAKVKVEVSLSAEHAPEGLKAGSRADLVMVLSSVTTKAGKAIYSTRPLAPGAEVVSVKRPEKKGAGPVVVELLVTKALAAKVERAKAEVVTVVEGGVPMKRPIPLRLEPARAE